MHNNFYSIIFHDIQQLALINIQQISVTAKYISNNEIKKRKK